MDTTVKNNEPEYRAWINARLRCFNPENKDFKRYGERGITMCEEWRNSFAAFLQHIGKKPAQHLTLDRIDNDKGYEPGNVRWATYRQQNANRRGGNYGRKPHLVKHEGREMTVKQWAALMGVKPSYVHSRLRRGKPLT